MHAVVIGFAFFIAVSDGFSLSLGSPKAVPSAHVPAKSEYADRTKPRIPFPYPVPAATRRDPRLNGLDNGPRLVTPTQESGPMFVDAYVIQPHDTLRAIATRYGLRVESLVGSNTLGAWITIGDTIRIPRRDGVIHTVVVEETVNQIAQAYQVDAAMIRTYAPNQLDRGQALRPGQELFIPEAPLPADRRPSMDRADSVATPMVMVQTDAQLWSGPGTIYKRTATVQHGAQLRAVAHHNGWLQVQADAGLMWVEQHQIQTPDSVIERVPEATDLPPAPPTWFWPTIGSVSSPFGQRALTVNGGTFHNGIDIANREGTPIYAIRRGTVIEAGWCRGFGYCVKLQHDDDFTSTYGHMMSQPLVVEGQWVEGGEPIGLMGTTYDAAGGGYSTGPHLHLTLKVDGQAVDPLRWLPSSR
ncbi:LysM peptidoglycan-binding domain-containing M23 family metallopeptidase [Herpetosiphon geysericola]|uniref:LysM peptidoglycan-binding domain-containing M23 family metallopeptidase n=1 Tax=Herpetosiphon geysericola TaxID=70996 RepID=UPI001364DC53|nr:LysM peptidoglycan-binding domain-containing M23 family metallopeptidase [Herpetosiphon geysericola]